MGEDCEGIAAFCAEAHIHRDTFFTWVKSYPEFQEAYLCSLEKAQRMWEKLPLQDKEISFPYWKLIYQNRFNLGRRRLSVTKLAPIAKLALYEEFFSSGDLTQNEYETLLKAALVEIQIQDRAKNASEIQVDYGQTQKVVDFISKKYKITTEEAAQRVLDTKEILELLSAVTQS